MTELQQASATEGATRWREAALAAVLLPCGERDDQAFDHSDIAARASVDEELLRSRWTAKNPVVVAAPLRHVAPEPEFPRTGQFGDDLRQQLPAETLTEQALHGIESREAVSRA